MTHTQPFHFCTYFDSNYLLRGLAMYRSLEHHCNQFVMYVLCLDTETFDILSKLKRSNLVAIRLEDIEAWDNELPQARSNRSKIEYYFTLSPILPLYLLDQEEMELITYLDADLFFYSDPGPIFDELGEKSILIIEHRFPDTLNHKLIYGRFNVQYLSFRNNGQGTTCLKRWRDQCLEWCHDHLDGDRFADQKYLDEWPEKYSDLVICQHKGAGVAPWNWSSFPIASSDGRKLINGEPLIFYHFHGLEIFTKHIISHGLAAFSLMPPRLKIWFYQAYVIELRDTENWMRTKLRGSVPLGKGPTCRKHESIFYAVLSSCVKRELMWVP